MCGRFTLTYNDPEELAAELGVAGGFPPGYRPRYNIAPTDQHWIVRMKREDREILPAKWGLINSWVKDPKQARPQINARSETAERSGSFRDAFKERHCVIPADGFFEWTGPKEARQPHWFHRPDGKLILFAGLYESWSASGGTPGEWERTFTILTTEPNQVMRPIHDRMPVILQGEQIEEWLFTGEQHLAIPAGLLAPAPDDLLIATPVSPRANSVKNDDPGVLEPAPMLI
jgi:putative SOS response-associated peptidase YedK